MKKMPKIYLVLLVVVVLTAALVPTAMAADLKPEMVILAKGVYACGEENFLRFFLQPVPYMPKRGCVVTSDGKLTGTVVDSWFYLRYVQLDNGTVVIAKFWQLRQK